MMNLSRALRHLLAAVEHARHASERVRMMLRDALARVGFLLALFAPVAA